jgi:hypothetical protein
MPPTGRLRHDQGFLCLAFLPRSRPGKTATEVLPAPHGWGGAHKSRLEGVLAAGPRMAPVPEHLASWHAPWTLLWTSGASAGWVQCGTSICSFHCPQRRDCRRADPRRYQWVCGVGRSEILNRLPPEKLPRFRREHIVILAEILAENKQESSSVIRPFRYPHGNLETGCHSWSSPPLLTTPQRM